MAAVVDCLSAWKVGGPKFNPKYCQKIKISKSEITKNITKVKNTINTTIS
jgi:hypothetical protein